MLEKIYRTHFGVGSCIRRAKVSLFWPGMTSDIKNKCMSCSLCAQYASQAPKNPCLAMISQIIHGPWLVKIYSCGKESGIWSRRAITVIGSKSMYCPTHSLQQQQQQQQHPATVAQLNKFKAHFARFRIPVRLITDNGLQFISTEYKQFASEYGFEHVTSSPYWPQGNGKAEAAVKIVERMYQKNKDIHLALLDYRNTPQQG